MWIKKLKIIVCWGSYMMTWWILEYDVEKDQWATDDTRNCHESLVRIYIYIYKCNAWMNIS